MTIILKPLRYALRFLLRYSPNWLRKRAIRLPFSGYKGAMVLFRGDEQITWRDVQLNIDPSTVQGYYIYFLNEYDDDEINHVIRLCRDADLFIDVGANIGMFSLIIAQENQKIKVHAFEPDPFVVKKFEHNMDINPKLKPRITLNQVGLADKADELPFETTINTVNIGNGRLIDTDNTEETTLKVPVVRMDSYLGTISPKSVIKIDVEGAELKVLQGMDGIFKASPPQWIMVEIHSFYLPQPERHPFNQAIADLLIQQGYRLSYLDESALPPVIEWADRINILATYTPSNI